MLVRLGSWFCYARDRSVPLPTPLVPLVEQVRGAADRARAAVLLDCEVSIGRVRADRREIADSTLPHRVGAQLQPEPNRTAPHRTGEGLRISDTDPHGRPRPRDWLPTRSRARSGC